SIDLLNKLAGSFGLPDQKLERPIANRRGRLWGEIALVSFQNRVKVGTAKSKGADSSPARPVGIRLKPGLCLSTEPEWACLAVELRVGCFDADRRRQHLVVERERRVDQPGQSSGAFGVADQRFDRSHGTCAGTGAGFLKELTERLDLDDVAECGAGA